MERHGSMTLEVDASKSLKSMTNTPYRERYQVTVPEITDECIAWAVNAYAIFDDKCTEEMDPFQMQELLCEAAPNGRNDIDDAEVLDMMRLLGKVDHPEARINFREFCTMVWHSFFKPKKEPDDHSDVQQAFQILGGGEDGAGEVSVDKLKAFTEEAQLTIDVDKFVAEVDDDASGLVDFEEFCKLFQKTPIPTDLHGVSATLLLRHSESNLNLTGDGEVGVDLTRSLNKSGFLSVDVHGEDSMDGGATAPHTLGVVASPGGGGSSRTLTTLPPTTRSRRTKEGGHRAGQEHQRKTERSVFNDTQVSCRSGWRFNQVRRNQPGVEGENVYNVRTIKYKDLDKFVTMRKKGAEFTVKESANSRLDVRAAPELRLLLMSRAPTRPPSRAQTAPVNAAASASFFYADPDASSPARLFSPPSRPATHADGAYPRERIRAGALYPEGRFQVAGSAGPMRDFHMVDSIGSPGQRSRSAAGFSIASRSARLPAAARTRPWLANMKLEAEELTTADVLRMAAIAGLYRGDGDAPAGGAPGISFFDAGD